MPNKKLVKKSPPKNSSLLRLIASNIPSYLNYIYLGFFLIIILGILFYSFQGSSLQKASQPQMKNWSISQTLKNIGNSFQLPAKKAVTQTREIRLISSIKKYTVQKGDTLWSIAEKQYGSGYNSGDLVKANNITDPNLITENQILVIPSVTPAYPTRGDILTGISTAKVQAQSISVPPVYTVKDGDCLWNIAVTYYNDGYMWVKIASANNLANPQFIHRGNVLRLPRS